MILIFISWLSLFSYYPILNIYSIYCLTYESKVHNTRCDTCKECTIPCPVYKVSCRKDFFMLKKRYKFSLILEYFGTADPQQACDEASQGDEEVQLSPGDGHQGGAGHHILNILLSKLFWVGGWRNKSKATVTWITSFFCIWFFNLGVISGPGVWG